MEALTGADILDLIQDNGEVDNDEVDPEIASEFPRTQPQLAIVVS